MGESTWEATDAMVEAGVVDYLRNTTTLGVDDLSAQVRRTVFCGIRDAVEAALAVQRVATGVAFARPLSAWSGIRSAMGDAIRIHSDAYDWETASAHLDELAREAAVGIDAAFLLAAQRAELLVMGVMRCIDYGWLNNRAIVAGYETSVLVEYVEDLRAERDTLRSALADMTQVARYEIDLAGQALESLRKIQVECDALREDAARYQHMRSRSPDTDICLHCGYDGLPLRTGVWLDVTVDESLDDALAVTP